MNKRLLAAVFLVSGAALAGCSSTTAHSGDGSTEHASTHSASPAASAGDAATAADPDDVMFAQMMIPHHEQAVLMSSLALGKDGLNDGVMGVADRIADAQGSEIEDLTMWLESVGASPSGSHEGHDMPGMLTDEQIDQLRAAEGDEFERLWLLMMVEHHKGAVAMSQDVVANGTDPDIRDFAEMTIDQQGLEIEQMTVLLAG